MSDDAKNERQESQDESNKLWLEQLGISIGKKKFWSSDKFLSLLAFLISIGTFFTFAYQTYLIQKQQYASSMPYLTIAGNRDGSGGYYQYSMQLTNNGVGPAFIQNVRVIYEDSIYQVDPARFYFNYVSSNFPSDSIDYSINNSYISKGSVIPAREHRRLLESLNEHSASIIKLFHDNEVVIEITYSSIYDEVWRVTSNSMVPEKLD